MINPLKLLFPDISACIYCGDEHVSHGVHVCPKCEIAEEETSIWKWCNYDRFRCFSRFYYDGKIKDAFLRYKFSDQRWLAKYFSLKLVEGICDTNADIITCVPLHKRRLKERGYNQSELIAKYLSIEIGINYVPLLKRTKHTKAQSTLNKEDRLTNIKKAFLAEPESFGKRILLIDDVITTGSTLLECAHELMSKGAKEVIFATLFSADSS